MGVGVKAGVGVLKFTGKLPQAERRMVNVRPAEKKNVSEIL
jgi:hypothetical protein